MISKILLYKAKRCKTYSVLLYKNKTLLEENVTKTRYAYLEVQLMNT